MANYNNSNNNRQGGDVEFKLVERLGVLDTHKSGWAREVNIVAWNGGQPKFDIRDWDPDHVRMSRGITLYEREAVKLTRILAQRLQMDCPEDGGLDGVQSGDASVMPPDAMCDYEDQAVAF